MREMAKTKEWEDMGVGTQGSGGGRYGEKDFKDYRLKLVASPEGARYKIRILGKAVSYMAHYPEKRNPKTNERQDVSFPDAEESNRLTRVCTDEDAADEGRQSHCPWCRLGFTARPRFLLNVVDYQDTDEDGDPKIKFIEIPKIAAQELAEWYRSNKEDFPGGPGDMEGEVPDFVFIVTGKPGGKGGPTKYGVQPAGRPKAISQSIINAIKKINPNATAPEETMALHDLERLCHPTYMGSKYQRDKFGEIIDKIPRDDPEQSDGRGAENKGPSKKHEDDDAPEVTPSYDSSDDDDVDAAFNTTVHSVKNDDDDDDDDGAEKAKAEVKW